MKYRAKFNIVDRETQDEIKTGSVWIVAKVIEFATEYREVISVSLISGNTHRMVLLSTFLGCFEEVKA